MKFLMSGLSYLLTEGEARRNLWALSKLVALMAAIVLAYAVLFHVIMDYEGQEHSWFTGFYWALTVMSTLGFGDITFHSDLGRFFSMVVLLSGIVLLLIVLPFTFIRYFYAPWLEAQLHLRAPRQVPRDTTDHVIVCHYDSITAELIKRIQLAGLTYFVVEPEAARAAQLSAGGVSVITGHVDDKETYKLLHAERARMVLANLDDATNTNITLTVKEVAPDTPVVAIVEDKDSVDVLELSGATHVLALKHQLGAQLAARVGIGSPQANVVGTYKGLVFAELPLHQTPFVGGTIRESKLRERTGLTVVSVWERARMEPAAPDTQLTDRSIIIVCGSEAQIQALNNMLTEEMPNTHPLVVVGGGKTGRAAIRALKARQIPVHVIEQDPGLRPILTSLADEVFIGDAEDLDVITRAGIHKAPSVVLTTHDDATNIYLAVYFRRLNPDTRIVSRIVHERNLEAIHRAGANFVLGYAYLAVQAVKSILQNRELVLLGEGVELFVTTAPASIHDKSLAECEISARTGLQVVAIEQGERLDPPTPYRRLQANDRLLLVGTTDQRSAFARRFNG